MKDDLLVEIGSIGSTNHDSLRAVGQLVATSEGVRPNPPYSPSR